MKRLLFFAAFAASFMLSTAVVFADDPFLLGDVLMQLGQPKFIGTANSSAGGPIFSEGSYSVNMNPALTGGLQFPALDFGYTGILVNKISTDDKNDSYFGANLHLGGALPTRLGVISLGVQGLFDKDVLGINAGIFRLGLARDLTENFYLGLSIWGGTAEYESFETDDDNSFAFAVDLGAWYRIPEVFFLKNVRFGVAFQNLGKTFILDKTIPFPWIFRPKAGVAASLVQLKMFELGLSADVALPSLMNLVFNTGLQVRVANLVNISAGWGFNAQETTYLIDKLKYSSKEAANTPYVMIGVRFKVDTSKNEFMHNHSFNEMMLDVDALWQQQYKDIHLFSVGAAGVFGERDNYAPVINTGDVRYSE